MGPHSLFTRRHDRIHLVRVRRRDRDADLPDEARRQAAGELGPGVAPVGGLVDPTFHGPAVKRPRLPLCAPHGRIEDPRVVYDRNSTLAHVFPPSVERNTPRSAFRPKACPTTAAYTRSGSLG